VVWVLVLVLEQVLVQVRVWVLEQEQVQVLEWALVLVALMEKALVLEEQVEQQHQPELEP
jgi:hypothetical protein